MYFIKFTFLNVPLKKKKLWTNKDPFQTIIIIPLFDPYISCIPCISFILELSCSKRHCHLVLILTLPVLPHSSLILCSQSWDYLCGRHKGAVMLLLESCDNASQGSRSHYASYMEALGILVGCGRARSCEGVQVI